MMYRFVYTGSIVYCLTELYLNPGDSGLKFYNDMLLVCDLDAPVFFFSNRRQH